jgi:hypothetical protein
VTDGPEHCRSEVPRRAFKLSGIIHAPWKEASPRPLSFLHSETLVKLALGYVIEPGVMQVSRWLARWSVKV